MPAGLLTGNAGTHPHAGPWHSAMKSVAFVIIIIFVCGGHTWASLCRLGFPATLPFSAAVEKGETFVLHRAKIQGLLKNRSEPRKKERHRGQSGGDRKVFGFLCERGVSEEEEELCAE